MDRNGRKIKNPLGMPQREVLFCPTVAGHFLVYMAEQICQENLREDGLYKAKEVDDGED